MMTLVRRKREWSVRPLAAMGRPEAEVITKPETEVTKSGNESWPEVTQKMRIRIKKKQMRKLLKMRPSLPREKKVHQVKFMFSKKATNINEIFTVDLTLCSKCQIYGEDLVNFCGLLRKHKL